MKLLAAMMCLLAASAVFAQDDPHGPVLSTGEHLDLGLMGSGTACIVLADARTAQDILVQAVGFHGSIRAGNGHDCRISQIAAEGQLVAGVTIRLPLDGAAQQTYVVVTRTSGAGDRFRIAARDRSTPEWPAAVPSISSQGSPRTSSVPASGFAPPSGNTQSVARQRALARVEQGDIRMLGTNYTDAGTASAPPPPQAAPIDAGSLIANSFMEGFNNGTRQAQELANIAEGYNQKIRQIEADGRAEQARRDQAGRRVATAREAARRRSAQRQQQAAIGPASIPEPQSATQAVVQRSIDSGSQTAFASPATSGAARSPQPQVEVIAMIEGVVVCPLNPDRAKLFGESTCYGPFQDGLTDHTDSYDISLNCGSSASAPRDLGMYGNNHVWGCNYGINPRRQGFPNIDQAARFGLNIPSRRTFHCRADIEGYCRD